MIYASNALNGHDKIENSKDQCRFVDHQYRDLSRDGGMLIGSDVDKALNEETAGSKRLWGMYLCGW